ncbi:APC family permease [Janibacter sp. G1551]|uniref:APC family permease n=1 Tax=Janibacter sp. G1551 TaxID=3420440 RepID=UPI003D058CA6
MPLNESVGAPTPRDAAPAMRRGLGLTDAVVIGLGSMLGAGVFVAYSPAADAASTALIWSLLVAGLLAWCNALSSARLAALHPESGGTYVYGRERLGPFWGHLAGWAFVVGKTASCAAMAFTVGYHLAPDHAQLVAMAAVLALTALNLRGVRKGALLTRVLVAIVLAGLLGFVVLMLVAPPAHVADDGVAPGIGSALGVLEGAGYFFFAFAGYARIATLGEEVRDPARTIPRAIPLALGVVLTIYLLVGAVLLGTVGAGWLAGHPSPIADAAEISGAPWAGGVLRVVAGLAALGALLGLILGVSRTILAMARDGHLPRGLSAIHPVHAVPHRAELLVGAVVIAVIMVADLRGAIGFSSFCVLTYYAIANASAWTLADSVRSRLVPAVGFVGCVLVAAVLPLGTVVGGLLVLALGALAYAGREAARRVEH